MIILNEPPGARFSPQCNRLSFLSRINVRPRVSASALDLKCLKYLGFTDFTLQKLFIMTTFFPQRTSLLYIAKWGRICANQLIKRPRKIFLDATSHLYNRLCPLVGRSVGWLVGRVTHSLKTSNSCIFRCDKAPL